MKHCFINTEDEIILNIMGELGFICHGVIPSNRVSEPIKSHSDVLYLKLSPYLMAISACQSENIPILDKNNCKVVILESIKPGYKTESYLNYIINDEYIIYNPKTAKLFEGHENKIKIHVNQGYTRCSTICVNTKAYITEDQGIYNSLIKNNLDCLLIEKGGVTLKGYNYGFIGGSAIKIDNEHLLFCGDITNSEDKNKIISFLYNQEVEAIFIKNKPLIDIGSAVIF